MCSSNWDITVKWMEKVFGVWTWSAVGAVLIFLGDSKQHHRSILHSPSHGFKNRATHFVQVKPNFEAHTLEVLLYLHHDCLIVPLITDHNMLWTYDISICWNIICTSISATGATHLQKCEWLRYMKIPMHENLNVTWDVVSLASRSKAMWWTSYPKLVNTLTSWVSTEKRQSLALGIRSLPKRL